MVFHQDDIEGHPMQPAWDQISEHERDLLSHDAFNEADYWAQEDNERDQILLGQKLKEQELDSE